MKEDGPTFKVAEAYGRIQREIAPVCSVFENSKRFTTDRIKRLFHIKGKDRSH